jgi:hypothetical protein
MNYVQLINNYAKTMPAMMPPIPVGHPKYGDLGMCYPRKGLIPPKGRWASTNAILNDASRNELKTLRKLEDRAPSIITTMIKGLLNREPLSMPYVISKIQEHAHLVFGNEHGAISTYDGIVTARGSYATAQDVWMALTATLGGVTLSWYDAGALAWTPGSVPSITAYSNGGTGGAVMNSASNGSWLTNPGGTNKKYLVSMGISTPNITGFSLCMLVDMLWAGSYSLTTNTTINPTTDVAVTRYSGTDANGNMMTVTLTATLTHTVAATVTVSYTNQAGSTGKTTISICPATGPLIHRTIFNTLHNSATVVAGSPFMPLTNGGDSGVRNLEQVVVSGGTITSGSVNHKIVRPLQMMPFIAANSFIEQDTTLNIGNMVELANVSQVCGCLQMLLFTGGTTATTMSALLRMVEG